ncbi:GHKL domain-containing protein [Spirosoma agri]|uniref:histidine kinase n=1 Tax=Spirosoma agri TaxID=1987381 RepID=A0A6M0INT7_9BACT|nr:sensor histidine kinase [Spirosoma agri]NEU70010.1 GHKL domain-containing protein [Spirosoma agri]
MKPFLLTGCWFILHCFLSSWGAYGQTVNTDAVRGVPPTALYLSDEYDAHSQNFTITQDHRGVMYIGNFAGVLEYDGLNWKTIPTQNITKVSALLTAKDGTIYVGGNGEFGYLRLDSIGNPRFVSLSNRVSFSFGEVVTVVENREGIFFIAKRDTTQNNTIIEEGAVFRWNGRKLTEWMVKSAVESAFQIDQTVYIFQRKAGICTFRNGLLDPVGKSNRVPTLESVTSMLPLTSGKALIITKSQGLFQLENNLIVPFSSVVNAYLASNRAASATVLSDRSIAIATLQGGIVLLAPGGQTFELIRKVRGLTDQFINAAFYDREGNLWFALNNGIAEIEVPSPITLFDQSNRLTGEVMDIRRVNNVVYLAATNGLFTLENAVIRPVPGLSIGCFALTEAAGSLFVATSQGVYQLVNGRAQHITQTYSFCITASVIHPGLLYVGTEMGPGILSVSPRTTPVYQAIPGLTERIFGITEDSDSNLWFETLTTGLYKWVSVSKQLVHYTSRQGLPTMLYNQATSTTQGLLVYNEKGIYRYDAQKDRFFAYNPFRTSAKGTDFWKNALLEDSQRNIWTVEGDEKRVTLYQKQRNGFQTFTTPFMPISTAPINVIYPDRDGIVWFGGRNGVVRYDPAIIKRYNTPYQALIRQIQTTGGKKLYTGYTPTSGQSHTLRDQVPTLPYSSNDISFEFSAANYAVGNALTFSYKLEDYDKEWSDSTSSNNKKDYTNLPPGTYRFLVKARNLYGITSQEAEYTFTILPPWYAHWWSIALLLIGAGLLLFWLIRWRLNLLVREKQELETLIQERTEEIVFQKEELEKQSVELAVTNDQLEKIDLVVQSINAEIDFTKLFQTIPSKFSIVKNVTSVSFLAYDKKTDSFRFRALRSNHDLSHVEAVQITQEQAEKRFLLQAVEEYEDIYRNDNVQYEPLNNAVDDLTPPLSLITIVIKNEGRIEGFITLENTTRLNAFNQRDLSLIRSLKEHLIAAFIKTRLLEDLENTLNDLKNTQNELIRQERLASVGQLTKGIVDRILNPLNYVNNFSQLSDGLINELIILLENQKGVLPSDAVDDMFDEMSVLQKNLVKIQEHSNSTTRILKDMQKLLREKSRDFLETDLNSFIESKARTSCQEMGMRYADFKVKLSMNLEKKPIRTRLLPNEFGQVIENMMSNAYYTLHEKKKHHEDFIPEIQIKTEEKGEQVLVRFYDNGKGMSQNEVEKLFSPFFTTKPTSEGTGLGLFMVKDIVETHRGHINITTAEGEFTEVLITLPIIHT